MRRRNVEPDEPDVLLWTEEELQAAKPPDRLTVTEVVTRFRELGKNSAITGLYPIEMAPFFRPIMDRTASSDVDMQVLCKPAQIGGTVALLENPIFYYIFQEPTTIMVCFADEKTTRFIAVDRLGPMIRDSVSTSHLYDEKTFNQGEISTPNGARVYMAWASSVAAMATKDCRIVIGDEIDKPGYAVKTKEASGLSLLLERTKSFPEGYFKHIFLSTPTTEEGNIITYMNACDVVLDWHARCPFCGMYQPLRWSMEYCFGFENGQYRGDDGQFHPFGNVVWDGGRTASKEKIRASSRYRCGTCRELWTSAQKNEAVRAGKEVPRTPLTGFERKFGNHINRIYSLFDSGKLENLVSEWVDTFKITGMEHIKSLQGFVNSTLAEPFKIRVKLSSVSKNEILTARCNLPPKTIPQEAVALTCFLDVQKWGFWFVVRAFAADYVSWMIDYGFLGSWEDVERLLFKTTYKVQDTDRAMSIWRAGIDTGGTAKYDNMSMTEETYFWIRENGYGRGCQVWATKGSSRPLPGKISIGKPMDKSPSGKPMLSGMQIISLNTGQLKDLVHYRLGNAIKKSGPQAAWLHNETGMDYAKQILAEEKRLNDKGLPVWVQMKRNNHLLDCECGCMALADPEWPGGGVNLYADVPEEENGASSRQPIQKRRRW